MFILPSTMYSKWNKRQAAAEQGGIQGLGCSSTLRNAAIMPKPVPIASDCSTQELLLGAPSFGSPVKNIRRR